MQIFSRLIFIVLLSLSIFTPTLAQETHPLLEMLAHIPDNPTMPSTLTTYVDYRAMELARPGAAQPQDHAEWSALNAAEDESLGLWMAATFGIISGSGDVIQAGLSFGDEWIELLGFDFFDIDRELYFGELPSDVVLLGGEFDTEAIATAFSARDFTSEAAGDYQLLCGADGCEEGDRMDFDNINPANPFGGSFGLPEPLLISADMIANTNDTEVLEQLIAVRNGSVPSLADSPSYQAPLEVIGDDAILIQAAYIQPDAYLFDMASLLGASATAEQIEQMTAELAQNFEPIPTYEMVFYADTATETEQVVHIVLIYNFEENAQIAADVLPGRLALDSMVMRDSYQALFESRGVETVEASVHVSEPTDKVLAVLTLRAPLAGNEVDEEIGRLTSSSLVYRVLIQQIFNRDTLWLTTSLPEFE